MQEILLTIAERCHTAATRRGKDTTGVGCIKSLRIELGEYWKAADRSVETPEFDEIIEKTDKLSDEDFTAYYEANLHNTAADELADILIVAATWLWEAKAEAGGDFKPERSIDVMLLSGAVQFVCGRMADRHDIERLRKMVNLKMRFNELRKD
jgi:hypothetical protein